MEIRGSLLPVCCAAEVPAEVSRTPGRYSQSTDRLFQTMERFIEANEGEFFFFVFVDSLTEEYDAVSERPISGPSSPDSPFMGKNTHKCYELLQQLLENTGSDIDFEIFASMDEQSIEDGTLLLATGPSEERGEAQWIRAEFNVASLAALNFRAATFGIRELLERVQEAGDKVLKRKHLGL